MPANWPKFAIEDIERSGKKLTEWEKGFIYGNAEYEGVKKRAVVDLPLTEKQESWLMRIHERKTEIDRIRFTRRRR